MTSKLKALRRVEAVQAGMTRLAECRLAAAEGACREAAADRTRLDDFVGGDAPAGGALARAALTAMKTVDRRLAEGEAERARQRSRLEALKRRAPALEAAVSRAESAARREEEARDIREVIEGWLARTGGAERR